MNTQSPSTKLLVIIRNDAPLVHCNDSPSYRSVTIELTKEQRKALALKHTHTIGTNIFFESISQCIIE